MRRGEVWWIAFDPSVGGEIQKTRPAVIVSSDSANRHLNRLQVVPISSRTEQLYSGETYVQLNGQNRKALADQLTTVSKLRVKGQLGQLSTADMSQVEHAIKTQLNLS